MIFVRHALPGERVRRRSPMTVMIGSGAPMPSRSSCAARIGSAPMRHRRSGRCGGCDFQHVDLAAQRQLKAQVVAEQPRGWPASPGPARSRTRLAERLPSPEDGLGLADAGCAIKSTIRPGGSAGPSLARGDPVAAGGMPDRRIRYPGGRSAGLAARVELIAGGGRGRRSGAAVGAAGPRNRPPVVTSGPPVATGGSRPTGSGRCIPAAADTLVAAVIDGLRPEPGERAFDLYCGVGLFAGALADAGCQVWGVESSPGAVGHARHEPARRAERVRLTADRVEHGLVGTAASESTWSCWTRPAPARAGGACTAAPAPPTAGRSRTSPAIRRPWRVTSARPGASATSRSASARSTCSR